MPYVTQALRGVVDSWINTLVLALPTPMNIGVLNYIITRLVAAYPHATYTEINALIGVLECAKLELYRRVATPYEDAKRIENGDVY